MRVPNLRGYPSVRPIPGECADRGAEPARVAARPAPARVGGSISLGSVTSALALAGLIGGLGYGAHALLQDLQRVGFAPLTQAPEVFATAPLLRAPAMDWVRPPDPGLPAYEWAGIPLAAAPDDLPARDGPISDIDPETSGVFAPRQAAAPQGPAPGLSVPDGPSGGMRITLSPDEAALADPLLASAREATPKVVLHATDDTWIRVRDGEAVIFEGILPPGGEYEVPERAGAPLLRTGNAGALFAQIGGTSYGPIGSSSVVLSGMSLRAEDLSGQVPEASNRVALPGSDGNAPRYLEASLEN